ncbi:MAG: tRNA uridine-5-carboxymethylaminomethyl(34) synthesis GTPase MnmE [Pseudomonadota bacterium]
MSHDTICAIATPPGRGGIGIVRLSGPKAKSIGQTLCRVTRLRPRQAKFVSFYGNDNEPVDSGLVLLFTAPHSFTGEDVIEFQGHGSPVVLDQLVQHCIRSGARLARPGEFSERAFLNDKLDLAQAEAIADLINSQTQSAARLALRSLQGEFSQRIEKLVTSLIRLRTYVEAAIDFAEEEIDFLADNQIQRDLHTLARQIADLQTAASRGRIFRDGMTLVLAGRPNAGKSSLLNALTGTDSAIVTDIPGTTRDILREVIQIDGIPLTLLDTAGLRLNPDPIEQQGIRKAKRAITEADLVLWIYDGTEAHAEPDADQLPPDTPIIRVHNKADLSGAATGCFEQNGQATIVLSAREQQGIEYLRRHLANCCGQKQTSDGEFMARRRHLEAITQATEHLQQAQQHQQSGELLAEDLRQCQQALSCITGTFTSDDLLGEIFSQFCIGK